MSDREVVHAATSDRIGDVADDIPGVHLRDLPPFTTLLVWTTNSLYRVVMTHWPEVHVQGGAYFPDPTTACLEGASIGKSFLKVGWIGIGLSLEIRSGGKRIITSPVRAFTTVDSVHGADVDDGSITTEDAAEMHQPGADGDR